MIVNKYYFKMVKWTKLNKTVRPHSSSRPHASIYASIRRYPNVYVYCPNVCNSVILQLHQQVQHISCQN